uniref:Apoptosis inducing factor mitochondria associated 5 n=1 Tax=Sinocyclocheilus anshuiensis TaxID=1608454 RepID=A0A671QN19_9TELE
MMEVEVGDHNVLLVRCDGMYSAISNQCTHYGAPLSKGVLSGHRVRCPWHGSCFNVKTGDLEEYPGIDCLPCHKVKVENNKVYVSGQPKHIKWMGARDQAVLHTVMLLGGGAASLMCAETLRQENYGGRIIMVSRDDLLPYDKTRLSKIMNAESESLLMRRMEFFHKYDIEVWLKKEALSIDTNKKTVTFDDGLIQCYDQILIATGCSHTDIKYALNDYLLTLLCLFFKMLEERGVTFYMNDAIAEVQGENRRVKAVKLKSGITIEADLLIVGIGVNPNSEFLKGSPIRMDSKNYVIVDKYMRTNVTDVYCAGDLTFFPLKMAKGQNVSIGHWQTAQAHGNQRCVYLLILPTFRSILTYRALSYTRRNAAPGTTQVFFASFSPTQFLKYWLCTFNCRDDEVVAAAGLNVEPTVSVVAERLAEGRVITKAEAE